MARSKLSSIGINAEYISSLSDLLDFIYENDDGIILVNDPSFRVQDYISRFSQIQELKHFSFVCVLDKMDSLAMNIDDVNTFSTTLDALPETMDKVFANRNIKLYSSVVVPEEKVEIYFSKIMSAFRFSKSMTGITYLKESVKILLSDENHKFSIMKDVYTSVAFKYRKEVANVEKSIRLAISKIFENCSDVFTCVFREEKVTNIMFINYLVDKIRLLYFYSK